MTRQRGPALSTATSLAPHERHEHSRPAATPDGGGATAPEDAMALDRRGRTPRRASSGCAVAAPGDHHHDGERRQRRRHRSRCDSRGSTFGAGPDLVHVHTLPARAAPIPRCS